MTRTRMFAWFIPFVLLATAGIANATTSITPKSSGAAFTMDFCLDSVTTNIRQCMYLMDPVTALPMTPLSATLGGALTETAPASDTASSGLNGRLQRIAQRLTSLIALLPASLGQKTMTASLPVVFPSDQSILTNSLPTPNTVGGLTTTFVLQPVATDNHLSLVKNGAGQVYHISVYNNSATVNYLRLYDAGTGFAGCNSATNLKHKMQIPANTSVGGAVEDFAMPLAFATGIAICVTTGYLNTSTAVATPAAIDINIDYQ